MPYKILILETARNDTAARREQDVKRVPSLQEHQVEHMYAIDWAPMDNTQPIPVRVAASQRPMLDENHLLQRLDERVEACIPDILIVNSGSLFHSYPDQVLCVLQTLKASHPALRIGFHPRRFEQHPPRPFFEYSMEMRDLMSRIF